MIQNVDWYKSTTALKCRDSKTLNTKKRRLSQNVDSYKMFDYVCLGKVKQISAARMGF